MIKKYNAETKNEWDEFVRNSKNGLFFFQRDFMEYHADRFMDFSLMFYKNDKLVALLPASIKDNEVISHGGLTFGGFVTSKKMTTSLILELFEELTSYLKTQTIKKFIYKAVPYIYHNLPAQEDLYALFRHGFKLIKREPSSTIDLSNKIRFSKGKKCGISKAKKAELKIEESKDFNSFFRIEKEILDKKYDTKPVHTVDEMELLQSKFPDNINLYGVFKGAEMIAGTVLFINKKTVHTQYIGSNEAGKEWGALDYLMDYLINEKYTDMNYFDFGISTENGGTYLNEGLIAQKEMFGARTVIYESYEAEL